MFEGHVLEYGFEIEVNTYWRLLNFKEAPGVRTGYWRPDEFFVASQFSSLSISPLGQNNT
jgi:hypothetical protein